MQFKKNPTGILYEGSSGIWQTVWLEGAPAAYIRHLELVPDLDSSALLVTANGSELAQGRLVAAIMIDPTSNTVVAASYGQASNEFQVTISSPQLWTPDNPFLYPVSIQLLDVDVSTTPTLPAAGTPAEGLVLPGAIDIVQAYTGMRKASKCRDSRGIVRFCLNNIPTFLYGRHLPHHAHLAIIHA